VSIYKKRNDSKYFSVELPFKYFFTKHICFEKKYWWRPSRVGKHRNQKRVHLGGRKILHHFKSFSSLTSKNFSIKTFFLLLFFLLHKIIIIIFVVMYLLTGNNEYFVQEEKQKASIHLFLWKSLQGKFFRKIQFTKKKKIEKNSTKITFLEMFWEIKFIS